MSAFKVVQRSNGWKLKQAELGLAKAMAAEDFSGEIFFRPRRDFLLWVVAKFGRSMKTEVSPLFAQWKAEGRS